MIPFIHSLIILGTGISIGLVAGMMLTRHEEAAPHVVDATDEAGA